MRQLTIVPTGECTNVISMTNDELLGLNDAVLTYANLLDIRTLMWLSCQDWKVAHLVIDNGLDYKTMPVILSKAAKVTISLRISADADVIRFLTTLFPDKAGAIRHAALLKHDIAQIVNS